MSIFQNVLGKLFSKERPRASRQPSPPLAVFFWTGAAPVTHSVRDISTSGLYLITEERWYPGTLIQLTLQKTDVPAEDPDRSITVQSRSVRWGEDGVGLQFVLPELDDPRRGQQFLEEGVDRRTLAKFLQGFRSENGSATVDGVTKPKHAATGSKKA